MEHCQNLNKFSRIITEDNNDSKSISKNKNKKINGRKTKMIDDKNTLSLLSQKERIKKDIKITFKIIKKIMIRIQKMWNLILNVY